MAKKKLPQSIQALVGEIGEQTVLLRLAILAHKRANWQVFRNIGESGYDIVLSNSKANCTRRIEVKTRQRIYTTSKRQNWVRFSLTRGERNASDFVIAYWFDRSEFYIVPTSVFIPVSGGKRYRFDVRLKKAGVPGGKAANFLDRWDLLHPDFAI